MTRLLTTSAILFALASPALAADSKDMGCELKDNQGNTLTYIFVMKEDHPQDATGTAHAVMYEFAFGKNEANFTAYDRAEPLWDGKVPENGAVLIPQANPDWTMTIGRGGVVDLIHEGTIVAQGACHDLKGEAYALQQRYEKNQRDRFVYTALILMKSLAGIASAIHGH